MSTSNTPLTPNATKITKTETITTETQDSKSSETTTTTAILHSNEEKVAFLKDNVSLVKDYPKEGINFRDITTLLEQPMGVRYITDVLEHRYRDYKIDKILGLESRGFMISATLADRLGVGLVLVRKKGKLPGKVIRASYMKEYGEDQVEIKEDSIRKGENVLIIDDLIATGGTLKAAIELVEKSGGNVVECSCMIELPQLDGIKAVGKPVHVLMQFDA